MTKNYSLSEYAEIANEQPTIGYNITSAEVYGRANTIAHSYPWLQPQTIATLAKYNASPELVQRVGNAAAMRELGQFEDKKNAQGEMIAPMRYAFDAAGWAAKTAKTAYDIIVPNVLEHALHRTYIPVATSISIWQKAVIKPTVRWSTAVFDLVPETAQNVASMFAGSSNYDLLGLWESTSLATMLDNREEVGDGYFMNQTLREEQARRARAFRGTIYGNAFTIGRGLTSWAGEKSLLYRYGSGVVDAAVMLALPDPSKYIAKGVLAAQRAGRGVVRGLQTGGDIGDFMRAVSESAPNLSRVDAKAVRRILHDENIATRLEAGITDGLDGENVDAVKFIKFLTHNPIGLNMVDKLVKADNRMHILEDVFKFRISTETADALAHAKTRGEVISALSAPFTAGDELVLYGPIGKYRKKSARSALLKTRWFTQMPKNMIIVSGDDMDNVDAIKNMALSMRTAGVDEDTISKWGDLHIQSFSARGTPTARHQAFTEYESAITHILRANGIQDQAIKNLFDRSGAWLDTVRNYLTNRMGVETDNGHLQMFANMIAEHGDPSVFAEFLGRAAPMMADASFAGPARLVHLLNRTRTLPDPRELRRLTRNPLFQKVFDAANIDMKKLPLASRRAEFHVTRYTDESAVRALQAELDELKSMPKSKEVMAQIFTVKEKIDDMSYTEVVKGLTGEARMAVDLIDHLQNRIWKPLNLATLGYIMRNGIDAQIRMAFGGVRSIANTRFRDPLEFIHIAVGLPGRGTKYSKSITGIDMTNLGVAKKLSTGEVIAERAASKGKHIFVGDRRFEASKRGRREARAYAERTGRPLFDPDAESELIDGATAAEEVQRQLMLSIGEGRHRIGFLESDQIRHDIRTGSFPMYARGTDGSYDTHMYTKGVIEQLQMSRKNEPVRRILVGIQQGKTDEEIAMDAVEWFMGNQGSPAFKNLEAAFRQGIQYRSAAHGGDVISATFSFREARAVYGNDVLIRQAIRDYLMATEVKYLRELTGRVPEIEFMAAFNSIGDLKKAVAVPIGDLKRVGSGKAIKPGVRATFNETPGIVTALTPDGTMGTFVPIIEQYALDGAPGRATQSVHRLIGRTPISEDGIAPGLPLRVPSEQHLRPNQFNKLSGGVDALAQVTDRATGWFFNILNDTAVRKLERSVTFRQYYYQEVSKHLDRLSLDEGRKLHADILSKAKEEGKTIRQYLGEHTTTGKGRVSDKIESLATRTSSAGTMTVGEVDDFARFVGLSKTKDLLYDAANKGNMVDALRIVMPFAQAWKDVLGTYMVLGAQHNIHMVRQFSRVYKGLEQADPDQDGRGFLFRDPQTNEVQFHFPLSGSLAKLFGVNAPLSAPLARLSQGINIYPALGPYAQLAVSELMPSSPKYDDLKELFLPYGETTLGDVATGTFPGWMRKSFEAAYADTENRANTYGNTYMETLRALSVNPKYDLSTDEGVDQLLADAKGRARVLTMMRAASQFLGPAAGTHEWKVPTDTGDQYVGVLMEELRKMQSEDYDTAVDRFLELYGDELILYVSSKSRSVRDGIEATEAFGVWERENRDIMASYERTGPYFGPTGSDYNFTVWGRQLEEGSRERVSDRELIRLAQLRVGSTRYRAMRKMFPDDPSEKQREVLAAYRLQLHEQFPGFPIRPEFEVGKLANQLDELRLAVNDPRLKDNPIIAPLKTYLETRDAFVATRGGVSLASKKKAALRGRLFAFGESLSDMYPEFDRLWTRVLSQEVE